MPPLARTRLVDTPSVRCRGGNAPWQCTGVSREASEPLLSVAMEIATRIARSIRTSLIADADPERAPGQQAYMKSAMPFYGVPVPRVRQIATAVVRGEEDPALRIAVALTLWDEAVAREERYAAMAVLRGRTLRGDRALLPVIEHMVRTGAWWDITDELAHRLADLLDEHPDEIADVLRSWSDDEHLWIRRSAIIAQLGRRHRVDVALLTDVILANADDSDFVIRKAIGWALRDYARTAPEAVETFLAAHTLSPLSVREARKHL